MQQPVVEEPHEYDYMDVSTVALGNGKAHKRKSIEYEMPSARASRERKNRRADRERYSPAPTATALSEKKLSTINVSPSHSESEGCYQGVPQKLKQPTAKAKKKAASRAPELNYEVPIDAGRRARTFASPPRAIAADEYDTPMDAMATL